MQGDPNAESKFQEVSKAYETLRDAQKRTLYDQVGREQMERMESEGGGPGPGGFYGQAGGGPEVNMEDLFAQFFGGGMGGRAQQGGGISFEVGRAGMHRDRSAEFWSDI